MCQYAIACHFIKFRELLEIREIKEKIFNVKYHTKYHKNSQENCIILKMNMIIKMYFTYDNEYLIQNQYIKVSELYIKEYKFFIYGCILIIVICTT